MWVFEELQTGDKGSLLHDWKQVHYWGITFLSSALWDWTSILLLVKQMKGKTGLIDQKDELLNMNLNAWDNWLGLVLVGQSVLYFFIIHDQSGVTSGDMPSISNTSQTCQVTVGVCSVTDHSFLLQWCVPPKSTLPVISINHILMSISKTKK